MSHSSFDRHQSGDVVVESYVETGFNFRMTDMQAALGVVQAAKLAEMVAKRRDLGAHYRELLTPIPGLEVVGDPDHGLTNYQSFWIVLPDDFPVGTDVLLKSLLAAGVHARHGVTASHLEPAFADLAPTWLPVTERAARQSVLLPIHHSLTHDDLARVADVVTAAARGRVVERGNH
jgi:dTDP-4-amino-4,6-dideoxygalactose transaminase